MPELNSKIYEGPDIYLAHIYDANEHVPKGPPQIPKPEKDTKMAFTKGSYRHIKDGLVYGYFSQGYLRVRIASRTLID